MAFSSFKRFVEQEMGAFPHFIIYAILEWTLIALLFIHGMIAFICEEFAKFFELKIPCLLCSRIDHLFLCKHSKFYYDDSICESHKKEISTLAYCHIHRKLTNIKTMCEGCLLSFAMERGTETDTYKSISAVDKTGGADVLKDENGFVQLCSCCGEILKMRQSFKNLSQISVLQRQSSKNLTQNLLTQCPAPSPRAPPAVTWKYEEARSMDLPHIKLNIRSNNDSSIASNENGSNLPRIEENKAVAVPSQSESDDIVEEVKTPGYQRGNKFFGVPLTDSACPSPRLARLKNKLNIDKAEPVPEPTTSTALTTQNNTILNHLKKQVRLDRQTLMEMYMELDQERSASAVAANNAMAMITRLQAEKASVQMEALQYQRMMEEQAEYDEEAINMMKDLLTKREEEMKVLEEELDAYRERYGPVSLITSEFHEVGLDENLQESGPQTALNVSERSDIGTSTAVNSKAVKTLDEFIDLEKERSYLLGFLTDLEKKLIGSSDDKLENEDAGVDNKDMLMKGVSFMRERLREIESDGGFIKHATMAIQKSGEGRKLLTDEGTKLLTEIAIHLRKLRQMSEKQFSKVQAGDIIPKI